MTCWASRRGCVGHPGGDYLHLLLEVRVVNPVVQAATLQGVVDFPGAVGGDDYHRRVGGPVGAQFGNGYLEVGQQLQQEPLKLLIGPVQLVDEQNRRALPAFVDGLEQGRLMRKRSLNRSAAAA